MRVLIISPHFPPTNAADMQRVRLILPYLHELGVDAEVLAVEADQVASPQDSWLAADQPNDIAVHRVKVLGLAWSRLPGLGILDFRAVSALAKAGDGLLALGNNPKHNQGSARSCSPSSFDLVYFSTTVFGVHVLGPRWKRKFGVPFVMDYQDPWVNDYYLNHPHVSPPGGRFKYAVASWLSRRQEPRVLGHCSGITSVSEAYPKQLKNRYPWINLEPGETNRKFPSDPLKKRLPYLTIPFPGDSRDIERVKSENVKQSVFDPLDGFQHWVYVGRGGEDMALAVKALFMAISSHPSLNPKLRLHFIGTSYAATGQGTKVIEPISKQYGLDDIVEESTNRIPYSETLRCLLDADALLIPGSDDPGYTASKIYPYLLAQKPLLAVFHEQSSVVELMHKVRGGKVVSFSSGESPDSIAARIYSEWLATDGANKIIPLKHSTFEPYSAKSQALKLVKFWKQCSKA